MDFRLDANIPEKYIRTSAERMEMYKQISLIQNPQDESDVLDELCDRYGEPPRPTMRLLWVAVTRALCEKYHISRAEQKDGEVRFCVAAPDLTVWSELFGKDKNLRFLPGYVQRRLSKGEDAADVAAEILRSYDRIAENANKELQKQEK